VIPSSPIEVAIESSGITSCDCRHIARDAFVSPVTATGTEFTPVGGVEMVAVPSIVVPVEPGCVRSTCRRQITLNALISPGVVSRATQFAPGGGVEVIPVPAVVITEEGVAVEAGLPGIEHDIR
jgi:hypothetical protein